jgi:hypothetical protein
VAAVCARSAGVRLKTLTIPVPMPIRSVLAASAPRIEIESVP